MRGLGRGAVGVEEVHAGLISGVAIGDEAQGLIFRQSARGLAQGHGGGQGIALRGDVIGRDVMPVGIEKEESVLVSTGDADIGFVAGSVKSSMKDFARIGADECGWRLEKTCFRFEAIVGLNLRPSRAYASPHGPLTAADLSHKSWLL